MGLGVIVQAVIIGMVVVVAGTIPRNLIFATNLRYYAAVPWAVPVTALYLWFFWRYLQGAGPPESTAEERRASLRANRVSGRLQELPDLAQVPKITVLALLLMAAPVAGIIEEAAFRGYMQGPIERRYGLPVAILITGTMFAVAHLDFTLILWPYYVAFLIWSAALVLVGAAMVAAYFTLARAAHKMT